VKKDLCLEQKDTNTEELEREIERTQNKQTTNKQTNKQQMVVGNDRKERYERKNYL